MRQRGLVCSRDTGAASARAATAEAWSSSEGPSIVLLSWAPSLPSAHFTALRSAARPVWYTGVASARRRWFQVVCPRRDDHENGHFCPERPMPVDQRPVRRAPESDGAAIDLGRPLRPVLTAAFEESTGTLRSRLVSGFTKTQRSRRGPPRRARRLLSEPIPAASSDPGAARSERKPTPRRCIASSQSALGTDTAGQG
jgi:hypothetical protein